MHVYIGPGCSYSFLHLTLQEYLTALHIAIVNPCDIELIEWLREGSVVVRFLAGICRHDDYHSHPVYQVLLQLLAYKYRDLMLVRCAYEHPSIMDSMKVFYKNEYDIINVEPRVGFDWYATGYCISHFDERWGLTIDDNMGMEGIDLLVKGLRSSSTTKGRIQYLSLSLKSLSFSQVITSLREVCELHHLKVKIHDDEVILQQLIAPGSGLRRLEYSGKICTNTLISLFQPSSLLELKIDVEIVHHELLSHENTNLKKLTISSDLLCPLATLIVNITDLPEIQSSYSCC